MRCSSWRRAGRARRVERSMMPVRIHGRGTCDGSSLRRCAPPVGVPQVQQCDGSWRAVPEPPRPLLLTKASLMTDSRVPRRTFLTAAAATVAGAAIGVAGAPARAGASSPDHLFDGTEPAPPHEIKLGVASY